jgi:hypothetical protein
MELPAGDRPHAAGEMAPASLGITGRLLRGVEPVIDLTATQGRPEAPLPTEQLGNRAGPLDASTPFPL